MRLFTALALVLIPTLPAIAQDNEIGLGIGFGFYRDVAIANAGGTAQAGFGPRFALSGAAGHNWGQRFAAEARYTFQDGDLELKSAGRQANLDGDASSLLGELQPLQNFATPFPTGVVAPTPGSRLGGWLHDFVPVLGISRII